LQLKRYTSRPAGAALLGRHSQHGQSDWERVQITAEGCPRISPTFLAEERRSLGERWYRQEYGCSFEDTIDAVFAWADIQAALNNDLQPLFPE
jgi:hypothetical protein